MGLLPAFSNPAVLTSHPSIPLQSHKDAQICSLSGSFFGSASQNRWSPSSAYNDHTVLTKLSFFGSQLRFEKCSALQSIQSAGHNQPKLFASAQVQEKPADSEISPDSTHVQVFPAPPEPLQFRAIALLYGKFDPTEVNSLPLPGTLTVVDGTKIPARFRSKMVFFQQKLDLQVPQWWVAYPRTGAPTGSSVPLRMEVIGVRNPVLLPDEENSEETQATASDKYARPAGCSNVKDYVSVRGIVVFQDQDDEIVVVRITPDRRKPQVKPFSLRLHGKVDGPAVGWFCSFECKREGESLNIVSSEKIENMPAVARNRFPRDNRASRDEQANEEDDSDLEDA